MVEDGHYTAQDKSKFTWRISYDTVSIIDNHGLSFSTASVMVTAGTYLFTVNIGNARAI